MGTVGHWGHVHTRQNLYNAIVAIEAVDGAWKITDLEVIEENRPAFAESSCDGVTTRNGKWRMP